MTWPIEVFRNLFLMTHPGYSLTGRTGTEDATGNDGVMVNGVLGQHGAAWGGGR